MHVSAFVVLQGTALNGLFGDLKRNMDRPVSVRMSADDCKFKPIEQVSGVAAAQIQQQPACIIIQPDIHAAVSAFFI